MNYKVSNSVVNVASEKQTKLIEISNVPAELLLFAEGSSLTYLKGISVWLILKNETSSGCIHNYQKQLPVIASKYGFSVRTLTKYIPWLLKQELLHTREKKIFLHSYNSLRQYGVDVDERVIIRYNINGENKLAEIILLMAKTRS